MSDEPTIYRGLNGVTVDTTSISKVMPETNSLTYRGYPVQDLCAKRTFEDVAYLLWHGELPTSDQRDAFVKQERSLRAIDDDVKAVVAKFPTDAHPMDTLRVGVGFVGLQDATTADSSPEANLNKAMNLLAKIPTLIAADVRHKKGEALIDPRDDLSMAENFYYMCFGKEPTPEVTRCLEISLILYAEHSFNASTFTGRVVTSTESDMYSAVSAAIGALKGPLHGGANEAVMHMLKEIGSPDKAEAWVKSALAEKRKIMGFGHRVYRSGDSRVPTMHNAMVELSKVTDGGDLWVEISRVAQETMLAEKNIHPNLDFPAGPAYYMMGFDIPVFTPIFVMSRITGWAAHNMEQAANNRLIRPLSAYDGPAQREVPSA